MITLKIKRCFFFGEHDAEPWHGMRFKISDIPICQYPLGSYILEVAKS